MADPIEQARASNRAMWDEWASFHLDTPLYREQLELLRQGGDCLLPFDAVLGDIRGKRVLHLQCHVGLDSLSLARRGAEVTGIDFSAEAIRKARSLAEELGIAATFLQTELYAVPEVVPGSFDIVYSSYGALCWIDDIARWARVVASKLAPGGRLVAIDTHPIVHALSEDLQENGQVKLTGQYFEQQVPACVPVKGSYADRERKVSVEHSFEWCHGLGDVIQGVLDAGLELQRLHEHKEAYSDLFEGMQKGPDRLWRLPTGLHGSLPLCFTLVARKCAYAETMSGP